MLLAPLDCVEGVLADRRRAFGSLGDDGPRGAVAPLLVVALALSWGKASLTQQPDEFAVLHRLDHES